uniref:Uncharacterized protein n=1 Tax=Arabidopsis thaliana TaxID=3702 RepID=Q5Q0I3_ARATH|nr:hypothetical protein AT1G07476 [Arabidopsis thaliana]
MTVSFASSLTTTHTNLSPFFSPLHNTLFLIFIRIGSILSLNLVMEESVIMFGKSESPRLPTRLQRQAPAALNLGRVPENPFLQQSGDEVAGAPIPLLSPLFVSPNSHSSLPREGQVNPNSQASPTREGHDFTFPVSLTEKKGSQPSMDHKIEWQHSAKGDHSDQMSLLNMFQTKFLLVDHPQ